MLSTFSEMVAAIGNSTELLLIKATVVLVLGLAALFIGRSARASVRHLLLTATFGVLLVLPWASAIGPTIQLEIPTRNTTTLDRASASMPEQSVVSSRVNSGDLSSVSSTQASRMISAATILQAMWATGVLALLAQLLVALWKLRRIRQSAIPWPEGEAILTAAGSAARIRTTVLLHEKIAVPVTTGFLRPAILLPADAPEWSESDLHRTFLHELEHIRRGDWAVHLMARFVCALYWFHPLVWVAWRKLSLEAERACDDAVLLASERTDYAEQLVTMARRLTGALPPQVLSMANRSDLSRRVSAILDRNQRRGPAGLIYGASSLVIAVLVLMTFAPLRAVGVVTHDDLDGPQKPSSSAVKALNRALVEAAEAGEIEEITKLLQDGAEVNGTVDGDGSALIVAAREGHVRAVTFLLDRGADPNLAVSGDGNPIIMAAREGHLEVVKLLLARGAIIDQVVPGDENALIQASGEGHLDMVKFLVSSGADVNARVWASSAFQEGQGEWRTPLNQARKGGHKAVVDYLLSMGARQ